MQYFLTITWYKCTWSKNRGHFQTFYKYIKHPSKIKQVSSCRIPNPVTVRENSKWITCNITCRKYVRTINAIAQVNTIQYIQCCTYVLCECIIQLNLTIMNPGYNELSDITYIDLRMYAYLRICSIVHEPRCSEPPGKPFQLSWGDSLWRGWNVLLCKQTQCIPGKFRRDKVSWILWSWQHSRNFNLLILPLFYTSGLIMQQFANAFFMKIAKSRYSRKFYSMKLSLYMVCTLQWLLGYSIYSRNTVANQQTVELQQINLRPTTNQYKRTGSTPWHFPLLLLLHEQLSLLWLIEDVYKLLVVLVKDNRGHFVVALHSVNFCVEGGVQVCHFSPVFDASKELQQTMYIGTYMKLVTLYKSVLYNFEHALNILYIACTLPPYVHIISDSQGKGVRWLGPLSHRYLLPPPPPN